ncbi:MAG: hypothetical protein E7055_11065 [Lentisphaerae bacterium]|nr:hypothetical protein [Lentisphaerota bacterium]
MKDMAKNTTAANRGQTRKPATRKQEQPPTGATAGMKPEHQTGATDRNTTKNRTIAAGDRDHAADPVSIQGKPEIDVIFNYVKNDFVAANVLCGRLLYSDVLNNRILIYAEIADETADMIKTMLKEAKR